MEAMAAMHTVGALPTGEPVFYAEEGRFDHPGLHVWDGEKHVRFVPATTEAHTALRIEIENAVNRHSAENGSNTPDFILAQFLIGCLGAFDTATMARERWYSRDQLPMTSPNGPAPVPMNDPAFPWPTDAPMMHEGIEHVLFMEGNITSDEKPFTVGLTRASRAKGEPARWTRDFHTFDKASAYFERQAGTNQGHPLIVTVGEGSPPTQTRDDTARARAELDNEFPVEATITGGDQDSDPPFEAPGNGPGGLGNPFGS